MTSPAQHDRDAYHRAHAALDAHAETLCRVLGVTRERALVLLAEQHVAECRRLPAAHPPLPGRHRP